MVLPTSNPPQRSGHTYPYEFVAADLREQIQAGALAPGSQLPTSIELAEQHNVSAGTVNRAVALLKEAGLIEATRGCRAQVKIIKE